MRKQSKRRDGSRYTEGQSDHTEHAAWIGAIADTARAPWRDGGPACEEFKREGRIARHTVIAGKGKVAA